ncbi:hypothetical protein UA08_08999 [Talaromyces atroroseus]|uniref:Major facilitator superfamily (MFS) profile domain-containing protein n=1 Tax=Talaromyces atroroseus TaxID=1441469 RepID=A0A1Q5Q7D2_TALAT|nr:hypothetical protein UA08_08999 [Talaromyces atroroseus]OKL55683.1 hypothetical protein UA08_08999 [Talaromyces atroroseus]
MWDIVRDSSFGQCLRIMSSRRLAKYPEERANFELPAGYLESCSRLALRSPIIESNVDPETVPQEKDDLAGATVIAWTSRPSIHWIVSMVGIALSMCGVFIITQCMFIYLPFTYPRYAGSLFAANGFARRLLAGASILFSEPMFGGIKVSGGVTLLASFSVLGIGGMFALYFFGAALRKRSRFFGM